MYKSLDKYIFDMHRVAKLILKIPGFNIKGKKNLENLEFE